MDTVSQARAQPEIPTQHSLWLAQRALPHFQGTHPLLQLLTISHPHSHHFLCLPLRCSPSPSGLLPAPHRSWGKLLWGWFCGLSRVPEQALSPAEKAALEQKLTSIEEEPFWRSVCNMNAIILLSINIFLWGYFA